MGFKEVNSLDADIIIALGKKDKAGKPYPKQAEGYYLGTRTVENKRGESKIHFLQTVKGNLGLWGTTDLNRKLGQASLGSMVRITSTGTKPTPNGDMYTYKVETDNDNTIDVSSLENSYSEDSTEEAPGFVTNDDEDEGYDREAVASAHASSTAERQAKVQALLAKNKKA